jgi:hypothetical protein
MTSSVVFTVLPPAILSFHFDPNSQEAFQRPPAVGIIGLAAPAPVDLYIDVVLKNVPLADCIPSRVKIPMGYTFALNPPNINIGYAVSVDTPVVFTASIEDVPHSDASTVFTVLHSPTLPLRYSLCLWLSHRWSAANLWPEALR